MFYINERYLLKEPLGIHNIINFMFSFFICTLPGAHLPTARYPLFGLQDTRKVQFILSIKIYVKQS